VQHQEILFKQPGQRFVFDPPDGRPEASPAPAVSVFDDGREVVATTGPCTIDPVDTRLHGDALAGHRALRLTSVDGVVLGGRYLMSKPEGDREWIEVVGITGDVLTLRHPLIHRYAGNATIVGCRLSVAVAAAWAGAAANLSDAPGRGRGLAGYVVRWRYTLDGFEHAGLGFADLVDCRAEQLVTPSDVEQRFPGWLAGLPTNQGTDFIAEAFRVVRIEAVGDAHAQRRIRDAHVLRELVNVRAHLIRLEHDVMHGAPRGGELAIAEQRYQACYARLITATTQKREAARSPRRIPRLTKKP
jgi:hypothetical protein